MSRNNTSFVVPEGKEAALQRYKSNILKEGSQPIEINRMQDSTLIQFMRIYKDPSVCLNKIPYISFEGEMAADVGGPKKEYFSFAFESFTKVDVKTGMQLFVGEHGHMVPLCSMDAISSGCFVMVGKLIAHGTLHCGFGFVGLAPACVKYITSGSVDEAQDLVTVTDVPDIELRNVIEKMSVENSIVSLSASEKDMLEGLMVRHGLTDLPLTEANKEKAIQDVIVYEVLTTRTAALDSIYNGMNSLSLGSFLRANKCIEVLVFPAGNDVELDVGLVKARFDVVTQADLNNQEKCNAHSWFFSFLEETDKAIDETTGKKMTSTLLMFITGSTVLGEKLKVEFNANPSKPLLEADSCFNCVILPVCHHSYEAFKEACITSLSWGAQGYGRF